MPLTSDDRLGKNKDRSINADYCIYCYDSGEFIDKEMKDYCSKLFPTLKRWKCTCTEECSGRYDPNCTCENPVGCVQLCPEL